MRADAARRQSRVRPREEVNERHRRAARAPAARRSRRSAEPGPGARVPDGLQRHPPRDVVRRSSRPLSCRRRAAAAGSSARCSGRSTRTSAKSSSRIKILAKLDIAERRRPQDGSFRTAADRGGRATSRRPARLGPSPATPARASSSASSIGRSAPPIAPRSRSGARRGGATRPAARSGRRASCSSTGPTGSGKSHDALRVPGCSCPGRRFVMLTAEDPVEYVYDELSQCEVNDGHRQHVRERTCACSCGTTPRSSWSARSGTARPPRWRSARRRPGTSC